MSGLFDKNDNQQRLPLPLAERIRPKRIEDVLGPEEVVGEDGFVQNARKSDPPPSVILWGPPGTGKTTLARLLADELECHFETLSAVLAGVKDVRRIVSEAAGRMRTGKRTLLFVDEIHRFNKAQQDAFLPHVENGTVVLVGATTENPSFEVISALLSRCRVIRLHPLSRQQLSTIAKRAVSDTEQGLGSMNLTLSDEALDSLCELSSGDARVLLNLLEAAAAAVGENGRIDRKNVLNAVQERAMPHDKLGDSHYNLISAFHKSLRGSDPDAALHYFCRMIEGGDDPLFLIRRMFNFASEDIGNADPNAIQMVQAAMSAFQLMGVPEGILPIAQAVVYLATAPKSNSVYNALSRAQKDVKDRSHSPVPDHLINAPTSMMKQMGFARHYRYPHNYRYNYVSEQYLPDELKNARYYEPQQVGFEREIGKRMEFWRKLRESGHEEKK
ncbi:MAG: replication-associated recombination protein A [Planctomycetota bacterium]|nr:replication-associated recombination protein A [Planctomycetota bacterium]